MCVCLEGGIPCVLASRDMGEICVTAAGSCFSTAHKVLCLFCACKGLQGCQEHPFSANVVFLGSSDMMWGVGAHFEQNVSAKKRIQILCNTASIK